MICPFCTNDFSLSDKECPKCKNSFPEPPGISSALRVLGWFNFIVSIFGSLFLIAKADSTAVKLSEHYPFTPETIQVVNYSFIVYGIAVFVQSVIILLIFSALAKIIDQQIINSRFLYNQFQKPVVTEPVTV